MLKAVPEHTDEHTFELKITNTVGEVSSLGEAIKSKFGTSEEMKTLPAGVGINANLNLAAKRTGTCYVAVHIDGQEVARTAVSIVPKQGAMTAFSVPPKESIG